MSTILDLVKSQLSQANVGSIAQSIGASPEQTHSAISEALPMLLGALSSKANSNTGLDFLTSLLDKNHDGSVLDDIMGMVTGNSSAIAPQGASALQALLGDKASAVEGQVAQSAGIDASMVGKLLPLLAPMILGALTKAQSSQGLSGPELSQFLEKEGASASSQSSTGAQSILSSFFDKNKDGSVIDDVVKMGLGFLK
jgi:hypothetical protein